MALIKFPVLRPGFLASCVDSAELLADVIFSSGDAFVLEIIAIFKDDGPQRKPAKPREEYAELPFLVSIAIWACVIWFLVRSIVAVLFSRPVDRP